MNTVEPIRDFDLILNIADYLKEKSERNYVLFMTGIHLGRRITDMLELRVRDVKSKNYLEITEEKTNKKIKVIINDELQEIYKEYLKGKSAYEPLFKSRQGKNKAICRQRAYSILKEAADHFEYKDSIGCHSMRKTFGYWLYNDSGDIVAVQELLNHRDPEVTKRYIGINQDKKDKIVRGLSFKKRR